MATSCIFRFQAIGPRNDIQALRRLIGDWVTPSTEFFGGWELHVYGFEPDLAGHSQGVLFLTPEHAHRDSWCQFMLFDSYAELVLTGRSLGKPPLPMAQSLSSRFPNVRFTVEGHTFGHGYERHSVVNGERRELDRLQSGKPESMHSTWAVCGGQHLEPSVVVPTLPDGVATVGDGGQP